VSGSVRARYLEVDLWKSVGIGVVVLIHCLPEAWSGQRTAVDIWLASVTRFAVPGFLMASGFLYATREPVPVALTLRRLRRILIPYLIASLGAQLFHVARGAEPTAGSVLFDLLSAASFGPYYYVMQIFLLVLVTPLFAQLCAASARGFALLAAVLVGVQLSLEQGWLVPPLSFFWLIRNPLFWAGFFLIGWMLRLHYAPIAALVSSQRVLFVVGFAAIVCALGAIIAFPPSQAWVRPATWLSIHAICGLLFVAGCGRATTSTPLAQLSDASYAIYLYHLFFVLPLLPFFRVPCEFSLSAIAVPWLGGMLGSLLVVAVARRVLGERSRAWIGA
jgi:surface polysaccharide O-acyltransferase-like enzyme